MKLLILEQDVQAATMLYRWFTAQHYLVDIEAFGSKTLDRLINRFDIILLGSLPDVSATELCRSYRRLGGQTPILMVADNSRTREPRADSTYAESALDSGADDFVPHTCSLSELSARVRALLRRTPSALNNLLTVGRITINVNNSSVIKNGVEIQLQPMELNLLEFFLRHPNQVFTARALHERIWKARITRGATSDTVRTHIKTLRRKIDEPGMESLIGLVPGKGYKLTPGNFSIDNS